MKFIKNFVRRICILLDAKFIFQSPKKTKLILFDYNKENEFKFFFKKDFEIINIRYEKIIPYIIPKTLSTKIPNICLSKSELNTFLILFRIKSEIKKITGIEIITLNNSLIIS